MTDCKSSSCFWSGEVKTVEQIHVKWNISTKVMTDKMKGKGYGA